MTNYYIVPQPIVDQYQDFVKGSIGIHFTQTNTFEWVINTNCLTEEFDEIPWETFQIVDLEPSAFLPDYTLPASGREVIIIPDHYQWLFPLDVEGYIIPLTDYQGQKILFKSYADWRAMRQALDSENMSYLKKALSPLLSFLETAEIITI